MLSMVHDDPLDTITDLNCGILCSIRLFKQKNTVFKCSQAILLDFKLKKGIEWSFNLSYCEEDMTYYMVLL